MSPSEPFKRRDLRALRGTPRSAGGSLWRTHAPVEPVRSKWQFLTENVWPWLIHYVKLIFSPRRPFPTYSAQAPQRPGILTLPEHCTVALAADWGTGTDSAYRVADQIRQGHPDITIHLGDVYYSGTKDEYRSYFLGPGDWPRGGIATYALNGNHEMYSGGEGYFDAALPALGQATSYFCLENRYWRILGVDTGYFARTVPLLELLLTGWIRLHPSITRWLAEVVFADPTDRRPVILLSHHQWFSAFDGSEYRRVARDLAPYLDRVLLWLWGHEHRFAGYGKFGLDSLPPVRARCIGHGGMPVELGAPKRANRNLVFFDSRVATRVEDDPIGYCGYAVCQLDGSEAHLSYFDEFGLKLLEERWVQGPAGVTGAILHGTGELTLAPGQELSRLVAP